MDHPDLVRVQYDCEVFSQRNIVSSDPNNVPMDPPNGDQYFNIKACKSKWNRQLFRHGRVVYSDLDFQRQEFFNIPKNSIEEIASLIPSQFGIPHIHGSSMATKILDFAGNMANNTHKDKRVLFMVVVIEVVRTSYYDRSNPTRDDHYHRAVQESMDNRSLKLEPASKSFIEGLKTVKLEEEEELSSNCAICLEEFKVGFEEATRMPCSHLFHKPCIVSWLCQNCICPLCRFKMPTTDQTDFVDS